MIREFILDLFFPKKCLACGRADTYLCQPCFDKIEIVPRIEQKQGYLDKIISAVDYRNPIIQELIKKFKYNYIKELAKPLSQLLIKSLKCTTSNVVHETFVIPVPLYKTRERSRGFNQAELLAKELADYFNLPLETNILKRIAPTEPQADIRDEEKRKKNIQGVFAINPKSADWQIRRKNIILIDDVATTSATLSEAAKILKFNGVNMVWGLVVARG